jgi:hypothetical protein
MWCRRFKEGRPEMKTLTGLLLVMFIMTAVPLATPNEAGALSLSVLVPAPSSGVGLSLWLVVELFINGDLGENITWSQLKAMFGGEGDGADAPPEPPDTPDP